MPLQLLERIRYLLEVARPPAAIAPLLTIMARCLSLFTLHLFIQLLLPRQTAVAELFPAACDPGGGFPPVVRHPILDEAFRLDDIFEDHFSFKAQNLNYLFL